MSIEKRVRDRISELIVEGETLSRATSTVIPQRQQSDCVGWLTSAHNAVHLACAQGSTYRLSADRIATESWGLFIHKGVGQLRAVLQALLKDADAGALVAVADQARAETFDDFLDHAQYYAKNNRSREAGVISGVVFEDSLRRVCRKHEIVDKDERLDSLISALTAKGILTATKAKRARTAAHVRTKATHAQWDEFEMSDVQETIAFTRELIAAQLDRSDSS